MVIDPRSVHILAVPASTSGAVSVATAEAAKTLVAVIQSVSRASILPEAVARSGLRAELRAFAHTVGAVPVGARERAQTGVVLGKALLHLASHADIASRWRRGRAAATG